MSPMTPVSLEKGWDKTQTADWNIFSRLCTPGGKVAQTRGSGFYPSRGVSWVGRIWRRVAGSRNRCIVVRGRQGREKPDSLKWREGTRIRDTWIQPPSSLECIASSRRVRSLSLLSPRVFSLTFFCRSRCPMFSTLRCPFGVPLCTQLRFSRRHSWLLHKEFRRSSLLRSISSSRDI